MMIIDVWITRHEYGGRLPLAPFSAMGFHNNIMHPINQNDSYTFLLGWGLVTVLVSQRLLIDPLLGDKCVIAFLAGCTICLLRQRDLRKRDMTLKTSWVGPLILAVYSLAYHYYFDPTLNSALNSARPTAASNAVAANMIVAQQVAMASVEGSLMIWLFRGYGLLVFSALATALWQGPVNIGKTKTVSFKEFMNEAADHYPAKGWWLPAATYAVMHLFIAYMLFQTLHNL